MSIVTMILYTYTSLKQSVYLNHQIGATLYLQSYFGMLL